MAGQLPRPWFRLGSMTRPTIATTTAPVTEQRRPVPVRIRPPIIRSTSLTDPAEPTTPQQSAKSPPQLPLPSSLTPPVKKEPSPPSTALTRPVVPSPSNVQSGGAAAAKTSSPKGRSPSVSVPPTNSESFDKESSKQPSPVPSPSLPKSIPAVPSPYQSPKPKATASPPSPLVLPPPQLQSVAEPKPETIPQEVERKTVVFQKVMEKPSPSDRQITNYHTHTPGFGKNGKQELKKHDDNEDKEKDKGIRAKKGFVLSDDKDSNTRVITMAGENRGAFMEVVLSDKNNNSRHLEIRQSNNESENNENPKDNKSKKKSTGSTRNVWPMKAFFNSNVQGINNSILMDSKFTHHDPGIHLRFSSMPPSADKDEEDGGQQ